MIYDYSALFLAGGMGLGALGFKNAEARLGEDRARFRILGSVDIDRGCNEDFRMLTGVPALEADLHNLTPAQLREYCPTRPDAVFSSAPCKGYSRLLKAATAALPEYQKMNELVYRCILLSCETWDEPTSLIALENVPGITSRGAEVLAKSKQVLRYYGFELHEGNHDCGEIGNLAQHRRRYLLVARRAKRVKAFVHKPQLHKVRACGEELEKLPIPIGPEGAAAGVLHTMPKIAWITWVKLALIPAGGDHRDLPRDFASTVGANFKGSPGLMRVGSMNSPFPTVTASATVTGSNGAAAIADARVKGKGRQFGNAFKVVDWSKPTPTIIAQQEIAVGALSVADPRVPTNHPSLGLLPFDQPIGTIAGENLPTNGRYSVADPRLIAELSSPLAPGQAKREVQGRFDLRQWTQPAHVVAGSGTNGGYGVADPRPRFNHNMRVTPWSEPTGTATPATRPDSGGLSVADVRPKLRNGMYGVLSWQQAAGTITGQCSLDNGTFSVSDPRKPPEGELPIIIAADNCWHRPLTTLELGVLQGLPPLINGKPIQLFGTSSLKWRERIGNAVPEGAGRAIGTSLLKALLASTLGTWELTATGIWVRQRDSYVMPEDRGEEVAYAVQ